MAVKNEKYDFGGIATKYGIRCEDGATIANGAFSDHDGRQVPLVWNHQHGSVTNVIGHAILEDRGDSIYAHCKLNNSNDGIAARHCLENNDLTALSIYANKLNRKGKTVMHGTINEVSLVLAGANPGALIDTVSIAHAMGYTPDDEEWDTLDEAYIYHGMDNAIELENEDDEPESHDEPDDITHSNDKEDDKVADTSNSSDKTAKEVFDSMDEDQKALLYVMVAETMAGGDDDTDKEDNTVKHNVFDNDNYVSEAPVLTYEDRVKIIKDGKRFGSLKESIKHHLEDEGGVLAHAYPTNEDGSEQTYGIANIDWLFPDAKYYNSDAPEFIKRDMDWVQDLMNKTKHVPWSRVKTMFADITEDEARAKGYVKGKKKIEEVFTLLKRSITPQTVYKKQKLDRDDVVDITDFDVVAWIRQEMRMMLNEEIARAVLVGDGRSTASDDKISEDHIKPIWKDDDLFTIKVRLPKVANETSDARAKRIINAAIRARKTYKGSGNPMMFTTADEHTEMLLLEDGNGYSLYKSDSELATKMRVSSISEVPVMEGLQETVDSKTYDLAAIIVNPVDYVIGADKGGEINTFDDFDIDYNQQKYLIETRCSGALVKPYSAIVIEVEADE